MVVCLSLPLPFFFLLLAFSMAIEKKAFVLRIQAETLKELERWAQEEFRSVNGQIEYLLNEALRKQNRRNQASADDEEKNQPET